MIKIVDLYKSFGENHVLNGVNLDVQRGETRVIIGRSGCGKSVLVKHMIGLIRPDQGQIIVDGDEITNHREEELFLLRRKFGVLFQGAALLDSMTVGENVGLGLRYHTSLDKEAIQERVKSKLALVGLSGMECLEPAELSGGMKKRVGLARAIAMDPEYIIYDEPTTGLDPIMADVINELIRRLQKELSITSIVVTHDIASATKIADRISMLHEGKIIFDGTAEDVLQSTDPIVKQFIKGSATGPIKPV